MVSSDNEAFDLPKLRVSFGLEVSSPSAVMATSPELVELMQTAVGHAVPRGAGGLRPW